jgi:hypothetical protein
MKNVFFLSAAVLVMAVPSFAQAPDTAPVDVRYLLEELKKLKDVNEASIKSRRSSAYQQVAAAAASTERAVAFWKDAVKAVQFEGAEHEGSRIQDWRDGEGEALNDRHCASAVRLHLSWLALNLQHAAGAETRAMLPKVLEHVNAVIALDEAAQQFGESIQKAKDRGPTSPGQKKNVQEDQAAKKFYDGIMRSSITGSPVARWLNLGDALDRKKGDGGWETVAGNVDGIYNSVILPEFRSAKDARLLDYWQVVLKREEERAGKRKLDVDQRDWTTVKRPTILWERAQDVLLIGQKNRAITEMFTLVKTYPQHPSAKAWITQLEEIIAPKTVAPTTVPALPSSSAVPAPVAIPPSAALPTAPAPAGIPGTLAR